MRDDRESSKASRSRSRDGFPRRSPSRPNRRDCVKTTRKRPRYEFFQGHTRESILSVGGQVDFPPKPPPAAKKRDGGARVFLKPLFPLLFSSLFQFLELFQRLRARRLGASLRTRTRTRTPSRPRRSLWRPSRGVPYSWFLGSSRLSIRTPPTNSNASEALGLREFLSNTRRSYPNRSLHDAERAVPTR